MKNLQKIYYFIICTSTKLETTTKNRLEKDVVWCRQACTFEPNVSSPVVRESFVLGEGIDYG